MYKIGLLYCKNGQALEEEMYNNGMNILYDPHTEIIVFTITAVV